LLHNFPFADRRYDVEDRTSSGSYQSRAKNALVSYSTSDTQWPLT